MCILNFGAIGMIRNILLAIIVLAVLGGVGYVFMDLGKTEKDRLDPWDLVPANAALVWEHDGFSNTWQRLSTTNLIWANLLRTPFFDALDSSMQNIQLHFDADEEWKKDVEDARVLVAAQMINGNDFDLLYLFSMPEKVRPGERDAYLRKHLKKAPYGANLKEAQKGAHFVHSLPGKDGRDHHFTQIGGVVIASATMALLEEALKQSTETPITSNHGFQKVQRTKGNADDGAIFIRSSAFENVIASFLDPDLKSDPTLPGQWIELDLNILPNKVDLAGMIDTTTHNNALVSVALSQESGKTSIEELAPVNTAALFSMALTDGPALIAALEKSGGRNPELVSQWSDSLDTDLDIALLSWMDEELGKIIVHKADSTKTAFAIGTSSESKAREHLLALGEKIDLFLGEADEQRPSLLHRETEIRLLAQPGIFQTVLGDQFKDLQMPYYAVLGSRVVLSDHLATLRNIINAVLDRNTLSSDLSFRDLNANASEQNSLYCYVSLPRFRPLLAEYLNEENAGKTEEWKEVWNDMGALILQVSSSGNGMSFVNITLRHQPAQLKESNTLWEAELEAPLAIKPQLLKDHNTGALDIFVQDQANTIYLFSNTGKQLWKAELTGRIQGKVHQVDRYKNGKLQMLFSTDDKIFLVDRNGNNVEGFPIRLAAKASAPVAIFDYDKDRSYRLLIACADNELRMYSMEGKAIKGWDSGSTKAPVQHSPKHIRIRNKDYIFCFDTLGIQYVLDRKGKSRYEANATMPLPIPYDPIIVPNSEIGGTKVYYHNHHQLVEWTIDGDLDTLSLEVDDPLNGLVLADMTGNGEQEFVLTSSNSMLVVQGSKVIMSEFFDAGINSGPYRFNFNDGDKVGLSTSAQDGTWLFDANIGPLPDMPLKGNTAFSIGDLNRDGRFELVVGSGGQLLVHQLR